MGQANGIIGEGIILVCLYGINGLKDLLESQAKNQRPVKLLFIAHPAPLAEIPGKKKAIHGSPFESSI